MKKCFLWSFIKKEQILIVLFLLICGMIILIPSYGHAKKPVNPPPAPQTGLAAPQGWPSWPIPVEEGPFYALGPLSFTYVNRPLYPFVEFIQPVESFSNPINIWWGLGGVNVWGSKLHFVRVGHSNPKNPLFPGVDEGISGKRKVYLGVENSPKAYDLINMQVSLIHDRLKNYSVLPEYIPESEHWEIVDINGYSIANQYFIDSWTKSWVDFLKSKNKAGEAMSDSGHSTPIITWPDNPWLVSMKGYLSFVEDLKALYQPWGGAVVFLATNEGLLHAFTTFEDNAQEKWAFMPMPSFKLAIYQEYLKMISDEKSDITNEERRARLTLLDGPIAVHDVEIDNDGTKNSWVRMLVGTTGIGTWLKDKEQEAWTYEGKVVSGDYVISGDKNAIGAYALDITDPLDPKEIWSFLNDEVTIYTNGELKDTLNLSTENSLKQMEMLLGRPVIGYTINEDETRLWHILLAGVDINDKYHLWDLNALTGEVLNSISLSDNVITGTMAYVEEYLPTRIAATLPKGEISPLLSEVYVYLSDGKIYRWDIQSNPQNPQNLLQLNFEQKGSTYGAPATQDFDATYLEVNGSWHQFIAAPVLIEKSGDGWGGGLRNSLVVLDITKLEEDVEGDYPYKLILKAEWGQINEIEDLQVKKTDPHNIAANIYLAIDKQQNSLTPVSAPIFYDGNILLASTGTDKDGNYQTLFYNVNDPLNESGEYNYDSPVETYGDAIGLGKDTNPLPGQAIGGAFIDEHGIIWSTIRKNDGTTSLVSADFGLDPEGLGFGSPTSGDFGKGIESIYWKIIN